MFQLVTSEISMSDARRCKHRALLGFLQAWIKKMDGQTMHGFDRLVVLFIFFFFSLCNICLRRVHCRSFINRVKSPRH